MDHVNRWVNINSSFGMLRLRSCIYVTVNLSVLKYSLCAVISNGHAVNDRLTHFTFQLFTFSDANRLVLSMNYMHIPWKSIHPIVATLDGPEYNKRKVKSVQMPQASDFSSSLSWSCYFLAKCLL